MNGLPPDFDPAVFVGHTLELVSFSANTVFLSFGNEISITVFGSFAHFTAGGIGLVSTVPVTESGMMALVGHEVALAEGGNGTLRLQFSNGQRFECYDDTAQYEAYLIRLGAREIVV